MLLPKVAVVANADTADKYNNSLNERLICGNVDLTWPDVDCVKRRCFVEGKKIVVLRVYGSFAIERVYQKDK